ncbi:MAG: hypothetical protein ACFCVF_03810, partial [Kineosporiaceae bacterium]
ALGVAVAARPPSAVIERAYLHAVSGGPLDVSPAALGPPGPDPTATPAVELLSARGEDPARRSAGLRVLRDDLLRWHPTPYELLSALLEAESAVALEAARRHRPSRATGTGPVVLDLRAAVDAPSRLDVPWLVRRFARPVAGERALVALVDPAPAPARAGPLDPVDPVDPVDLVEGVETVPDRLVRARPSAVLGVDVLGSAAPALARFAALSGCAAVGIVRDLDAWQRPGDAAAWLRQRARGAVLHDLDLVLAADRGVAAGLVRWLGLAADRVVVLAGPAPDVTRGLPAPGRSSVRTVHCLASGRATDDVACVVAAAATATARDGAPRHVVVRGALPPGGREVLDRLLSDLGRYAPSLHPVGTSPEALSPTAGDVVVDASHDGHHVRDAVAVGAGVAPVLAVRGPAAEDVLGEGAWLFAPRDHAALAAVLVRGSPEWAGGQAARARESAARHETSAVAAVARVLGTGPPEDGGAEQAPGESAPGESAAGESAPATTVVLSSWASGAPLDLLLARAGDLTRDRPVDLVGVDHESLSRGLARAVGVLDAAVLVTPDPGDALVAVTDHRADAVALAVAEAYGLPVVTAEPRLFAVHIDTRGPHATVPLVATSEGEPSAHDLVVLRSAGARPAGSGMARLSHAVRQLVVTSQTTSHRVSAEGGAAAVCSLPRPATGGTSTARDSRTAARESLGVAGSALVVGCLAGAGHPARAPDRLVSAAGWLALWGHPATVLLPGWIPPAEQERLADLAMASGCDRPPFVVQEPGEQGVRTLVAACDVLVHLGEADDGGGPGEVWPGGARWVTTSAAAAVDSPTVRLVPPFVTPLLLAEEVLDAAGHEVTARPAGHGPAASGTAGAGPDHWVECVLDLVEAAP